MTLDKPQVGRTNHAEDPDWVSADVGATKSVTLTSGDVVMFQKTANSGWVAREQTKKEKQQNTVYKAKNWCASCKHAHSPGVHTKPITASTTATSSSGGYTTTTYRQCDHDGLTLVYTCKNGAKLYGAGKYGLRKNQHDVIIDMAGNVKTNFICGGDRKFHALKKYTNFHQPEILNLDWDDYGIPPVTFRFWTALLGLLEGKDVTLTCWGGHGRTGTAIAALMIADGQAPNNALRHIWKTYCTKAVETISQEEYLFDLVGEVRPLPVPVQPTYKSTVHANTCKCTECLTAAVERLGAVSAKEHEEEDEWEQASYVEKIKNRTADEEWNRYQQWARAHPSLAPDVYDWKTE